MGDGGGVESVRKDDEVASETQRSTREEKVELDADADIWFTDDEDVTSSRHGSESRVSLMKSRGPLHDRLRQVLAEGSGRNADGESSSHHTGHTSYRTARETLPPAEGQVSEAPSSAATSPDGIEKRECKCDHVSYEEVRKVNELKGQVEAMRRALEGLGVRLD
ncbi:hypothetical protein BDY21DRAFT_359674 [Lineolata rhizophorae]|uniref:Uncharacterized protein n=1 Tax=Lineolata rhizophorae TaxID=578093 RepID=A0A6A6NLS8_9PEZI|nr:hypothetical protein BDY21DRAFT_359674 [Lineolata rhizophorae]